MNKLFAIIEAIADYLMTFAVPMLFLALPFAIAHDLGLFR